MCITPARNTRAPRHKPSQPPPKNPQPVPPIINLSRVDLLNVMLTDTTITVFFDMQLTGPLSGAFNVSTPMRGILTAAFDGATSRISDVTIDYPQWANSIQALTPPSGLLQPANARTLIIDPLCAAHAQYCTGADAQWGSVAACTSFLTSSVAINPPVWRLAGDNLFCRAFHARFIPADPATHCPHIGPTGGGQCVEDPLSYDYALVDAAIPPGTFNGANKVLLPGVKYFLKNGLRACSMMGWGASSLTPCWAASRACSRLGRRARAAPRSPVAVRKRSRRRRTRPLATLLCSRRVRRRRRTRPHATSLLCSRPVRTRHRDLTFISYELKKTRRARRVWNCVFCLVLFCFVFVSFVLFWPLCRVVLPMTPVRAAERQHAHKDRRRIFPSRNITMVTRALHRGGLASSSCRSPSRAGQAIPHRLRGQRPRATLVAAATAAQTAAGASTSAGAPPRPPFTPPPR